MHMILLHNVLYPNQFLKYLPPPNRAGSLLSTWAFWYASEDVNESSHAPYGKWFLITTLSRCPAMWS